MMSSHIFQTEFHRFEADVVTFQKRARITANHPKKQRKQFTSQS